jgi:hypothetical protein
MPESLIRRAIARIRKEGAAQGIRLARQVVLQAPRQAATRRWIEQHLATIPTDESFFSTLTLQRPRTAAEVRKSVAALDGTLRRRYLPSLADEATARAVSERLPHAARATVARADDILAGRLSWLVPGYPDGASPPRWHATLEGGDWPKEPIWEIDITGPERPGDVRRIWELSRHQWLGTLARAFLLTGDERYADAALSHIIEWTASNPFGVGVNWLHAQEAALRIKSWLLVLAATAGRHEEDTDRRLLVYKMLGLHADYVARTLSDGANTHNHLVTEVAGLLALGVGVPALQAARKLRLLASAIMQREVLKQFFEEGAPGEGATSYHLFVLESVLESLALRRHAVLPVAEPMRARVLAMLDFARRMLRPDGTLPLVGDADAGRGYRLTDVDDGRDRRGVQAVGALLFGRGDMATTLGAMPEEAAWLLGAFAFDEWDRLPREAAPPSARLFQCSGFAVMRNDPLVAEGQAQRLSHLVFVGGATAPRVGVLKAHRHADALSLAWWWDGEEILTDPGVYLYSGPDRLRSAFRATAAHSTLQVDDHDHFDVTTWRFGVGGLQLSHLDQWESCEGYHLAAFSAPASPDHDVTLLRQVLCRPHPGYVLVCDGWRGHGRRALRQWWQVGSLDARPDAPGVVLERDGRLIARVLPIGDAEVALTHGGDGPGLGFVAPRYGVIEPATTIGVHIEATLPVDRMTLLLTADAARYGAPSLHDEEGARWLEIPVGNATVDRVRIEGGRAVAMERRRKEP